MISERIWNGGHGGKPVPVPAPVPLFPPLIPHELTSDGAPAVRSRRLALREVYGSHGFRNEVFKKTFKPNEDDTN